MTHRRLSLMAAAMLSLSFLVPAVSAAHPADMPQSIGAPVDRAIEDLLATRTAPLPEIEAALGGRATEWLTTFYRVRGGAPLWVSTAAPTSDAEWVLDLPSEALSDAVRPLMQAAIANRRPADAEGLAKLDLLLSAIYAASSVGRLDPLAMEDADRSLFLLSAARDRHSLLRDTLPVDPGFWRLRREIGSYRRIGAAGGWPEVPPGPNLELGGSGPRVEALRGRLIATGDLGAVLQNGTYDAVLQQAVIHFQARHGLQADGVVGPKTLGALNVPVSARLEAMIGNLVRLQRQHRDWGQRYIAVNIPAAAYKLASDGHVVFERPAVVGMPSWPTPTLDSIIDRIQLHPYWRIPTNIAEREVWPKQDADPDYFAEQGIHLEGQTLVQDPGPLNPLGAVKFIFDNPYSVYLHDTAAPGLLSQTYRFLSHGCIRLSNAADLARRLLASDADWPAAKVDAALQSGRTQTVLLRAPIPVHIVYDTVWVTEDGTVEFREDIYHRGLPAPAPTPAQETDSISRTTAPDIATRACGS